MSANAHRGNDIRPTLWQAIFLGNLSPLENYARKRGNLEREKKPPRKMTAHARSGPSGRSKLIPRCATVRGKNGGLRHSGAPRVGTSGAVQSSVSNRVTSANLIDYRPTSFPTSRHRSVTLPVSTGKHSRSGSLLISQFSLGGGN